MDSRFEKGWKKELLDKISDYEGWFRKSRAINYRRDESVDITVIVSKTLRIGVVVYASWNHGGSFMGQASLSSLRKLKERKKTSTYTYLPIKELKSNPLDTNSLEKEIESVVECLEKEDQDLKELGYQKNRIDLFYPYFRFYQENGHTFRMEVNLKSDSIGKGFLDERIKVSLYHIQERNEKKESLIGTVDYRINNHIRCRSDAVLQAERTFPDWLFRKRNQELGIDSLTHLQTLPEGLKEKIIRGDQCQ